LAPSKPTISGPDGQVHVVDGELAAIALAQALHIDNYFVAHHVIDGTDPAGPAHRSGRQNSAWDRGWSPYYRPTTPCW
jgi:hypothetical protein